VTTDEVLAELSAKIEAITLDFCIGVIEIELTNPETLNSKIACDALRRTIARLRQKKVRT
jgi:hypothetical protein